MRDVLRLLTCRVFGHVEGLTVISEQTARKVGLPWRYRCGRCGRRRLHPDVEDRNVEIPAGLADRYRRSRALLDRAKRHLTQAENEIRERLGAAATATCDGQRVASRTVYDRKPYHVGPGTVDRLTPARRSR